MHFLKTNRCSDSDLYVWSTKGFIIRWKSKPLVIHCYSPSFNPPDLPRGQKLASIPLYSRNDESSPPLQSMTFLLSELFAVVSVVFCARFTLGARIGKRLFLLRRAAVAATPELAFRSPLRHRPRPLLLLQRCYFLSNPIKRHLRYEKVVI